MVLSICSNTLQDKADMELVTISTLLLPQHYQFDGSEQSYVFELVRLAFFALKLHKIKQSYRLDAINIDASGYQFQCNLLQHAIFQQVLRLTKLGARQQALQLIKASQN